MGGPPRRDGRRGRNPGRFSWANCSLNDQAGTATKSGSNSRAVSPNRESLGGMGLLGLEAHSMARPTLARTEQFAMGLSKAPARGQGFDDPAVDDAPIRRRQKSNRVA